MIRNPLSMHYRLPLCTMLLLSIVYVMMLHNAATAAELGRHRRGQAKYGGVRDDAVHEIIKELERNKKPKGHGRTHHRNRHTSIAVRQPSRAFDDECDKENDSKAGNTGDSRLTRESERFRSAENTLSSVEDRRLDVSSFANYMRSRNAAPLDRRRMKSSRHLDESKPASRRNLDVDDMKKPRTRQPIKDTPSWHKKKLQEQKEIQKKQERVLASFRRRHKKMRSRIQDVVEAVLKPYRIPVAPFGNVQPLNLINKGGFGEVHRCMIPVSADGSVIVDELDETTKADYKYVPAAMKSSVVSKGQRQKVAENEVQVLKLARFSPHLLQIIAEVATPPRFPLKNILVEIAEFGSLDSFLDEMQRENTQLSLPITISLITDMFQGVQELHEKRHLHCDITPGNFLLFSSGVAKLSDFGKCSQQHNPFFAIS